MKRLFINQEGTSNKFWNIEIAGKKFTVTYGKIGTNGTLLEKKFSTGDECLKEAIKLISEKLKKGYKEVLEAGKPLSEKKSSSKKGSAPTYQMMSYQEAEKKYHFSDYIHQEPEPEDKVLIFEGDTTIDGNFELIQHEMPHEAWGYVVTGNLTIKGRILDGDMDYGPFLVVKGDLYADSITTAGAELRIVGNAFIKKFIYTYYNHGTLEIDGNLKTKLVICSDHNTIVKGKIDSIILNDNGSLKGTPDFDDENWGEILKEDIIAEEYLDDGVIMEYISKGKNFLTKKYAALFDEDVKIESFLKKGTDKATSIVQEAIDKIIAKGKKVEVLKIVNKKLTEIPTIIFELKDLKELDLSENPINAIPADIKNLINLEKLILKKCNLKTLPDEVVELTNLQELDVSSNSMIQYNAEFKLGEWLGKLVNLKVLRSNYNLCFPLPKNIVQLKNLEELSLYQCSNGKEIDFPEEVTKLTSLKKLQLGSNSFRAIPKSITNLSQLEELNLDSSLCYVKELPDLSGLIKLKVLHADGNQSFTERPFASQHLVKQFLTIPNLEELHIDRFGEKTISVDLEDLQKFIKKAPDILKKYESNTVNEEEQDEDEYNICLFIQAKGGDVMKYYNREEEELRVREYLNSDYLKGIGKLKKLRILDLSFNGLTSLPEEIYELRSLENINLEYNNLPVSQRKKLKGSFPSCQIDFSNNTSPHASDEKYFKEMLKIIGKANQLMTEKKSIKSLEEALSLYDQVLDYFTSDKVVDSYNLLYAHYGKGYTYAYLNNFLEGDKSSSKKLEQNRKEAINTCLKMLDLIPPLESIWTFSDLGAFQKEACRFATNSLAWDLHIIHNEPAQLEKALEWLEKGIKCIEDKSHYYIYDTQVRILLKLNRIDEAYKIVKKVLGKDSDFHDFKDIKASKEYKKWLSENE